MTNREAALKSCKDRLEHLENAPSHHCGKRQRQRAIELEKVKIESLRPITREQVEKVWRGEWKLARRMAASIECECSKCQRTAVFTGRPANFCEKCGSAMTDEAVQMVMERLEALYEV